MEDHYSLDELSIKIGFDPEYLQAFQDKLFIEGPEVRRRLTNFFVLLSLATVIATYGVLGSSTATVIGAMIVAPLMGPIMATAAAVVMGSAQRAGRSLALAVVGILVVVGLSTLLAFIVPDVSISFTTNTEITSRIYPGLYALITALGAGAAGAFITSRAEIADSMGGVAIAISLVPPLCVVGIGIAQGEWLAAAGAMLLFLTNFLAILLAGGIIFMLTGLGRLAITNFQSQMRRRAFFMIGLGTLLVSVPLSNTAYRTVTDYQDTRIAKAEIQAWLEGTEYHLVMLEVDGERVGISIEGVGEQPSLVELTTDLANTLNRPVTVSLRNIPTQIQISSSGTIQENRP